MRKDEGRNRGRRKGGIPTETLGKIRDTAVRQLPRKGKGKG